MRARSVCVTLAVAAVAASSGCAEVDPPQPTAVLPTDYRTLFVQVRGCRPSSEHAFRHVIVRTRPDLASLYETGPTFPPGALIVKEEYGDEFCRDLAGYTAMRKEKSGYYPASNDWQWFTLDVYERIVQNGKVERCAGCHRQQCGDARDRVCAM
jgi:cytochrome P460